MGSRKTLKLDGHIDGIAIPVSALRSREGSGIGEFLDLPDFGAWAKSAGFDLIQILPVNDTGSNASPYSAVSAFALHPVYIRLQNVSGWETHADDIRTFQGQMHDCDRVDFERVLAFKLEILGNLFHLQSQSIDLTNEWIRENPWVRSYSVYKCLKAQNELRGWEEWEIGRDLDGRQIEALFDELGLEALFHAWVQYELDKQFTECAERLEAQGIYLKGDVPILMSVDSADVWAHRTYFDLNFRAGAPPDMFSTLGQMWGFPIYDWSSLEEADYDWWRERLNQASRYYHAFRIDHVLGFFRIWSVPATDNTAVLGQYRPALRLTPDEVATCADHGDRAHRLTRAWTTQERATEILGEESTRVLDRYFERAPGGDYVLQEKFDADSTIERLGEDDTTAGFLLERRRNRTFVEAEDRHFAPAWFSTESSGYREADDESRARIDTLVRQYHDRSKPVWLEMGRRLLTVVKQASPMLPCAEDLGVVPPGLPDVLSELDILSLKIERWEVEEGGELKHPSTFPYLSVSTPGVHDTSTLRGWWEEEGWNREALCRELGIEEAPSWLTPDVARAILQRSLESNAAIRIFQIQDLFALTLDLRSLDPAGDRINTPGSVGDSNWRYALPILVEDLPQHDLTEMLIELVQNGAGQAAGSTRASETD